jgi:uncharacterized damage-inducible protein DinB
MAENVSCARPSTTEQLMNAEQPPVESILVKLIAHMRWADALVADALEHRGAPEKAIRLFAHIAAAEHLWYARIMAEPPRHPVWPELSVGDARALSAEHAGPFQRLVVDAEGNGANADALSRVVQYRNSAGREFSNIVSDILTHVAVHGSHHRGQIAQLVRASGQEPPYVDYIQFVRRDQVR